MKERIKEYLKEWPVAYGFAKIFYCIAFFMSFKLLRLIKKSCRKSIRLLLRTLNRTRILLASGIVNLSKFAKKMLIFCFSLPAKTIRLPLRVYRYIHKLAHLKETRTHAAAIDLIKTEGLFAAYTFLTDSYKKSIKPFSIAYLIQFLQYLIRLENSEFIKTSTKKSFIIHFCSWGESYCAKAVNFLIPSLLSENNLPYLSKIYDVVLIIHCDNQTYKRFEQSKSLSNCEPYLSQKIIHIVPNQILYDKRIDFEKNNLKYYLLGGFQSHAFKIALHAQAYISFLMPDVILSESFYLNIKHELGDKTLALTTSFRASHETIKNTLTQYYSSKAGQKIMPISAKELRRLLVQHIHPSSERRIVSPKTNNFTPCAQLIFPTSNGYVIRCYTYHPVLLDCERIKKDIHLDYLPIDDSVLAQVIDENIPCDKQVYIADGKSDMVIVEISDQHIEQLHPSAKPKYHSREELLNLIKFMVSSNPSFYNSYLNRYAITIRHEIDGGINTTTPEDLDDVSFFQELYPNT